MYSDDAVVMGKLVWKETLSDEVMHAAGTRDLSK